MGRFGDFGETISHGTDPYPERLDRMADKLTCLENLEKLLPRPFLRRILSPFLLFLMPKTKQLNTRTMEIDDNDIRCENLQ